VKPFALADSEFDPNDIEDESINSDAIEDIPDDAGINSNNLRTIGRQYLALIRCSNPTNKFIAVTYTANELLVNFGGKTRCGDIRKKVEQRYCLHSGTLDAWITMLEGTKYTILKRYLEKKREELKRDKTGTIQIDFDEMVSKNTGRFPFIDLMHQYDQIDDESTFKSVGKGILKI